MTSNQAREAALELLNSQVSVLLLGQGLFRASPNSDVDLYRWWLESTEPIEERARKAQTIGDATLVSDARQRLFELAWSSVVTSAIESTTSRALEIPRKRLVTQIATPEFSAVGMEVQLKLLRLFGTVDRQNVNELPPPDRRSLPLRRHTAVQMLGKLASLITPNGRVAVMAWNPANDWLRPSELAGALAPLAPGQAHIFGIDAISRELLERDDDFISLLEDGVVTLHSEDLAEIVAELSQDGRLPERASQFTQPEVVSYPVLRHRAPKDIAAIISREEIAEVTFDLLEWRSITTGQLVLQELDVTTPLPNEPQERYQAFRDLLSRGPGHHNIRWIREIAFRRPIVDKLLGRCLDVCRRPAPQETVLVVRGQSGAGKSVVLCQVAIELRRLGLPVVYIPPTILRPDRNKLDQLAQKINEASEAPVFLLYDGLREEADYLDLAEYFAARLRKCVVVGTSYNFQAPDRSNRAAGHRERRRQVGAVHVDHVDVDVRLTDTEADDLLIHLERFVGLNSEALKTLTSTGLNHFFAVLYRSLPEVRGPLENQFLQECLKGAEYIERNLKELEANREASGMTLMELRLREALGNRLDELVVASTQRFDKHDSDGMALAMRQLFNAVMFVSRLGQLLPQSLALRLLGSNFRAYRGSFTAGLFDDKESAGGYGLAARNSVEAEIWTRRHIADSEAQMNVVRQIAMTLSPGELADDYSPELEFLVAMLRAIGPNGPESTRLRSHYGKIAELIADLRKNHREVSPRLSLLEANAVREWVQRQQLDAKLDALDQFLKSLQEAEAGLRKAFDALNAREEYSPRAHTRRLLASLETERACVIGTMVGSLARCLPLERRLNPDVQARANQWLREARDAWVRALRLDEENSKGIDASCWIIAERFKVGFESQAERMEWLAEWDEMIARYGDIELTPEQENWRDEREMRFREELGDTSEVERIVASARARGSYAADAIIARQLLFRGDSAGACLHLEKNCGPALRSDRRLSTLYLRSWWTRETNEQTFFPRQRMRLSFDSAHWSRFHELLENRLDLEPEVGSLLFLKAVALIHLDRVADGVEILRTLDRDGHGGYRRLKVLYLHSSSDSRARQYSAVFQGKKTGGRHLAYCDALRQNVAFIPQEHGLQEVRHGRTIGPFHLAIQFRGLYADPLRRINDH